MPGATRRATVPDEALTVLDTDAVRRWAVLIRATLALRRAEIDDLNVFPVPDGDTGTNLFLTFDGALDGTRLAGLTPTPDGVRREGEPATPVGAGELLLAFAKALLHAARGNSGVILSQLARGVADVARGHDTVDAATLALGLQRADELAWQAVTEPRPGTVLSVSRAAATAAGEAVGDGLHAVASAALAAAVAALEETPHQLDVLARAGVVDAGGAGYVVVLECLERVCAGDAGPAEHQPWPVRTPAARRRPPRPARGQGERPAGAGAAPPAARRTDPTTAPDTDDPAPRHPDFEVMYLLDGADDDAAVSLRARLAELGDSVLVVGGDGEHHVHVHADDAGAAIEAGLAAGRPHGIRVARLEDTVHAPGHPGHAGPDDPPGDGITPGPLEDDVETPATARVASGIVACAGGPGLQALFEEAGAAVVASGPSRRASTGQLIAAVRERHRAGADAVVVLPDDSDTELAAGAAVRAVADDGIEAHVVRAGTAVQGVAALAVFDPDASAAVNVLAMQSAAAATRHGAVTTASRSALTSAGPCEPGDVLGIVDGDIVVVGHDLIDVARDVVHRLLASGGELLTVVLGEGAPSGVADAVARAERAAHLGLEVSTIEGGQPVYPLLLGVE